MKHGGVKCLADNKAATGRTRERGGEEERERGGGRDRGGARERERE